MRRLSLCFLLTLAGGFSAMPKKASAADQQTVQNFETTVTRTVGYKYLLSLPTGYDAKSDRRWPLLVFLHGSGERGDDIWTVAKHGPPKLLKETPTGAAAEAANALRTRFVVVSPQCPKNVWWDTAAVLALIDETLARHAVDPTRVYLTGLSMGGFGTWDLALAHPERFAAIAPICGGGQFALAFQANATRRNELRSLGVWAFHGAKDETVPLAESERMVDLLKKLKAEDVQLSVYPEARHDSWTESYANPELYTWLLKHMRSAGPAKP